MAAPRVTLRGLIPVGLQVITLSNSTAVAINSTVRASHVLHISVETNNARYRADGTAPALTTGVLMLATNSPYWFFGYNGTSQLKFQRTTGTSKVTIMGYKHEV